MTQSVNNPFDEDSNYVKEKYLSSGSFGSVCLAEHRVTHEKVAVKSIPRGHTVDKNIRREVLNHQVLEHPHIVKCIEVFLSRNCLNVVMEYVSGGDMFDFIEQLGGKPLDEAQSRWFFQQLIIATDYCHAMGVVNRDIKLENTLVNVTVDPPTLKLCDFGYSKDLNTQSAPDSRVGTPAYLAPEVIQNPAGSHYDAFASDVWSCGVMLYVLLTQCFPFSRTHDPHDDRMRAMIDRICRPDDKGGPDYVMPAAVSDECKDLLKRILVRDPMKRLKLEGVMQHPWFRRGLPEGACEWNRSLAASHLADGREVDQERLRRLNRLLDEAETVGPAPAPPPVRMPTVVQTGQDDVPMAARVASAVSDDAIPSPFASTDMSRLNMNGSFG